MAEFCTATSKSTRKRCQHKALPGSTVCRHHGGAAPQVRRAANRRLALLEAQRMVDVSGTDMHPIEHLLYSLHRAAQLEQVWSVMVAGLDDATMADPNAPAVRGELTYGEPVDEHDEISVSTSDMLLGFNKHGEAQVHPYVTMHERALDRLMKAAKLCLDAGVEERRVQIERQRAQALGDLFRESVSDPDIGLTPGVQRLLLQSFAKRLRALPA